MFMAALFTIAKCWKQSKHPPISKWVDQKTVVCLHNELLHSKKKEGTSTFCNSMDGTGDYYTKWNKPDGERQIPYDLTYKTNPLLHEF